MAEETAPVAPPTAEVEEGKGLAAVGYLGILFLIPLLARRDNAYCQHHAKQGAVLFAIEVIGGIILFILGIILGHAGCAGSLISSLLNIAFWICCVGLSIWGLIMALKGVYWKMPVIAPIAEKLKF
jgi:uncharacterized membrane protein